MNLYYRTYDRNNFQFKDLIHDYVHWKAWNFSNYSDYEQIRINVMGKVFNTYTFQIRNNMWNQIR